MSKILIEPTFKQEVVFALGRFIGIKSHSVALIFSFSFKGRYNLKM